MPSYSDVKEEAIRIVDEFATKHNIEAEYGNPPHKPRYSASTRLPSVGINVWVRRAMPKLTSSRMRDRFGSAWQGIGASQLEPIETIGAFIELMCQQTLTPVAPPPEPT